MMIDAPAPKVWEALTNPDQIKQYLFGTNVETDWKEGSPITYKGEWQGKQYEDKGKIVKVVPNQHLHTTYWSGLSGQEDLPENYKNVIYELKEMDGQTTLTLTQDNEANEESAKHSEENWQSVLNGLKKIVEK